MSFFFFKQKTAYEMRISDWGSDVCSSDLFFLGESRVPIFALVEEGFARPDLLHDEERFAHHVVEMLGVLIFFLDAVHIGSERIGAGADPHKIAAFEDLRKPARSEEHTSETPVTNAQLVCRLLLEKKKQKKIHT